MSAADRKMINESSAADIRCCGGDDGMMLLLLVMLIICYIIYYSIMRLPVSKVPPIVYIMAMESMTKRERGRNKREFVLEKINKNYAISSTAVLLPSTTLQQLSNSSWESSKYYSSHDILNTKVHSVAQLGAENISMQRTTAIQIAAHISIIKYL